jgi:hypothetical protein
MREQNGLPRSTSNDPSEVLKMLPLLRCVFCNEYKTHIEFDMDLHLYEMHKKELLKSLPVGRGYNMDSRIEYVLNLMKANAVQRQQKSPGYQLKIELHREIEICQKYNPIRKV